jgi:hypothetical protein
MSPSRFAKTLGHAAEHMPGLRNLPIMRLVLLAEVVLIARNHIELLTPRERRRLVVLVREARGRPRNLSPREREELEALVAKAEPKLFAAQAAEKLSPVGLPKRFRPRG